MQSVMHSMCVDARNRFGSSRIVVPKTKSKLVQDLSKNWARLSEYGPRSVP